MVKKCFKGIPPGGLVVRTLLPPHRAQVGSLVGELRSRMPPGMTKTKKERETEVTSLKKFLKAELVGFTAKPEVGVRGEEGGADAGGWGVEVGQVWGDQELILEVKEGNEARVMWRVQSSKGVGVWRRGCPACPPPNVPGGTDAARMGSYLLPISL